MRKRPPALGADLFGKDLALWASDPEMAFDGWIAGQPARSGGDAPFLPSTAGVYRAMFRKFAAFLRREGASVLSATPEALG